MKNHGAHDDGVLGAGGPEFCTELLETPVGVVPLSKSRAPNRRPVERHYGVIHARESGSSLTACGQCAVGGRIFWELRFRTTDAHACRKCIEAVAGAFGRRWCLAAQPALQLDVARVIQS